MLIENVIGNVNDEKFKNLTVDYVNIEWYNSSKKIHRLKTEAGVKIGIRLSNTAMLRGFLQDDVIFADDEKAVAVNILPCDALVMTVSDVTLLPKFCYEIGNRHAPFFYGDNDNEFVTPFDKPIKVLLEKIGVNAEVKSVKINLSKNISSSKSGGHSH